MPHIKSLYQSNTTSAVFSTLQIGHLLRKAGISKSFGYSSLAVFQILFSLVFEGRNWFCLLESDRGKSLPRKDVVYRFLNQASFNWRKFLHSFALKIVLHFESLISSSRTRVFIVDDSVLSRNRSKKAELLARVFDHTTGRFTKGFNIVRIHGVRWNIETFFKFTKSYLKCGTEFQGRSFDMLISHTTVVFSRYLVMEFERRQENDPKSLGGLFFLFAEVRDLDYQTALQQLITLFLPMAEAKTIKDKSTVFCQLREWISGLPSYIKGLFNQKLS
ncbi:hypothetical protein ABEX47_10570 [Paenibacillus ehimensis]|uniref:hypothetical protein n=1 Tax=Paenibacillus ehimensis TaxID=79264 RepID=UPI003D2DF764